MQTRREELIYLSKNNAKLWHKLQPRKKKIENNITSNQWFEYARQVYEKESEAEAPQDQHNFKYLHISGGR